MIDLRKEAGSAVDDDAEQNRNVSSKFADIEGEHVERWDRRMNVAITVLIVMAAAAAIFWPVQ